MKMYSVIHIESGEKLFSSFDGREITAFFLTRQLGKDCYISIVETTRKHKITFTAENLENVINGVCYAVLALVAVGLFTM